MESVSEIFDKYNTDKNSFFHNYCRQYEDLFEKLRDKEIKYLEIGIFRGESIKAMKEVFKNSKIILGIDINPDCKKYEDVNNNIFVEIGDASDKSFLEYIFNKYGDFDVILDDGSHTNEDVIKSFEYLFHNVLKDNGLYVVEDTICYKSNFHLKQNYPNHLTYFSSLVTYLNQWRFDSTEGIKDHCIDPYKIMKKTNNVFEYSIDKIEFGCSYIAIKKKVRTHWI